MKFIYLRKDSEYVISDEYQSFVVKKDDLVAFRDIINAIMMNNALNTEIKEPNVSRTRKNPKRTKNKRRSK